MRVCEYYLLLPIIYLSSMMGEENEYGLNDKLVGL